MKTCATKCGGKQINTNDGFNECSVCGYVSDNVEHRYVSDTFKSRDNVNTNRKTVYRSEAHFADVFDMYHGEIRTPLSPEILAYIDADVAKRYGVEYKSNLTMNDIKHLLKVIRLPGNRKLHNYTAWLYHHVTGKELMNVRHMKEAMVSDFLALFNVWQRDIKSKYKDRKSFLSCHYILYQLLNKYGFVEESKQVLMLKNHDKIKQHNALYSEMCKRLGWEMLWV